MNKIGFLNGGGVAQPRGAAEQPRRTSILRFGNEEAAFDELALQRFIGEGGLDLPERQAPTPEATLEVPAQAADKPRFTWSDLRSVPGKLLGKLRGFRPTWRR